MPLSLSLTSQADPSVTLALTVTPDPSGDTAVVGADANGSAYSFNLSGFASPDPLTLKATGTYVFGGFMPVSFSVVLALGVDPNAPTFSMDVEGAPMDDGVNGFTLSAADYAAAKAFFAGYAASGA